MLQTKQNYYLDEKAVLVVCKILLESKMLVKTELFPIMHSLVALCSDDTKVSAVKNMLQEGMQSYIEPEHGKEILDQIWNLENAVKGQRYIEIRYGKGIENGQVVRKLKPMGVIIFKRHFYLIADVWDDYQESDKESRLFKIDEIQECIIMDECFKI